MDRWTCWKPAASATAVGGLFFPQREALGLDARELTPGMVQRITYAAAETRSFQRAAIVLKEVGGSPVSAKTIHRVTTTLGQELAAQQADHRCAAASEPTAALLPAAPPALAAVYCDGGRIRTREAEHGPGVHQPAWRETKNACLLRMTHQAFEEDPHPQLPAVFCNPEKVAQWAEIAANSAAEEASSEAAPGETEQANAAWPPQRLVRSCVSSLADVEQFGPQVEREARRRHFFAAEQRAFLGDGLAWNWSLWQRHFPDFIPILDFIHPLSYLYRAALVIAAEDRELAWSHYLKFATACWEGRVDDVRAVLRQWLAREIAEHPSPDGLPAELSEQDPRRAVIDAARYLDNQRSRMDYPRYRRSGLPVTTAHMESLVKEINYRVKGTEMFWNDPHGAEAILQLRAAALCDDDRLAHYLTRRPGSPYQRRPLLHTAV